jgi:hypothetical protein
VRERTVAWAGVDGPEPDGSEPRSGSGGSLASGPVRVDAAHVVLDRDSLTARGTSVTAGFTLDWLLLTRPAWVTRGLSVRARGEGWARGLDLTRDDDGRWLALRRAGGVQGEHLDVAGLEGALDCDLALCPFTNTMPILRHGLVAAARHGGGTAVDFVVAWVDVPELTLHVSPQRYTPVRPAGDGGAVIGFTSGDFEASIEVDPDGIVRDYPGLATRLTPVT